MGIKASKKANITDPPPKDKKLKRKKSKKEEKANNAENGGIEEVGIQQKQSLIEELTKVIHSKENKEESKLDNGTASAATEEKVEAKRAETASAGSTDAPTDIVQDSPDKDTAGVAVISEVLSPSSQTSPIAEEPKVQEQKVESPVTEAAAAPEKETPQLPVETKPEVPSTLEIKPDISAAEVKSSPPVEKTEAAVVEAKAETPVAEETKVETKESPVAVEPKVESPVEAKVETPVVEEPKPESPAEKQDTPVTEEPKIQSPVAEEPIVASPVAEEPKVATPVAEAAPAAPATEEPKVATPVAEEPIVASPVAEEPKVATPVAEEPKVATPVAEEPKVVTPVAEAPATEELKEKTPVEEIPAAPVSEALIESPLEESKADSLPSPPESPTSPESVPVPESPVEAVKLEEIKNEVTEMASPDEPKPVLEEPASPVETQAVNDKLPAEDVKIESPVEETQAPITNGVNGVKHELTNGTVNGEEQGDHTEVATLVWKKGGDQVSVLGDFNQWEDKCILHKQDDVFSTKIKLNKGTHHLKYIVDGVETVDDSQPTIELDGHGQVNILTV